MKVGDLKKLLECVPDDYAVCYEHIESDGFTTAIVVANTMTMDNSHIYLLSTEVYNEVMRFNKDDIIS